MSESFIMLLFFALFGGVFVLIFVLGQRQKRKIAANFEAFAAKMSCQANIPQGLFGGFPSCQGTYRNRPLRVYMFTRSSGSGKSRSTTTYTAFEIDVNNPDGFEFNIFEQGFFTSIAVKFGMQDIQIGDDEFDKEYIIKSNNEAKVMELLTPMIKQKFMEFADRFPGFGVKLQGAKFYYESAGTMAGEAFMTQIETMIQFMCDLADQLDSMVRHRR